MPMIKLPGAECVGCGYKWIPRIQRAHIICPKCKNVEVV